MVSFTVGGSIGSKIGGFEVEVLFDKTSLEGGLDSDTKLKDTRFR